MARETMMIDEGEWTFPRGRKRQRPSLDQRNHQQATQRRFLRHRRHNGGNTQFEATPAPSTTAATATATATATTTTQWNIDGGENTAVDLFQTQDTFDEVAYCDGLLESAIEPTKVGYGSMFDIKSSYNELYIHGFDVASTATKVRYRVYSKLGSYQSDVHALRDWTMVHMGSVLVEDGVAQLRWTDPVVVSPRALQSFYISFKKSSLEYGPVTMSMGNIYAANENLELRLGAAVDWAGLIQEREVLWKGSIYYTAEGKCPTMAKIIDATARIEKTWAPTASSVPTTTTRPSQSPSSSTVPSASALPSLGPSLSASPSDYPSVSSSDIPSIHPSSSNVTVSSITTQPTTATAVPFLAATNLSSAPSLGSTLQIPKLASAYQPATGQPLANLVSNNTSTTGANLNSSRIPTRAPSVIGKGEPIGVYNKNVSLSSGTTTNISSASNLLQPTVRPSTKTPTLNIGPKGLSVKVPTMVLPLSNAALSTEPSSIAQTPIFTIPIVNGMAAPVSSSSTPGSGGSTTTTITTLNNKFGNSASELPTFEPSLSANPTITYQPSSSISMTVGSELPSSAIVPEPSSPVVTRKPSRSQNPSNTPVNIQIKAVTFGSDAPSQTPTQKRLITIKPSQNSSVKPSYPNHSNYPSTGPSEQLFQTLTATPSVSDAAPPAVSMMWVLPLPRKPTRSKTIPTFSPKAASLLIPLQKQETVSVEPTTSMEFSNSTKKSIQANNTILQPISIVQATPNEFAKPSATTRTSPKPSKLPINIPAPAKPIGSASGAPSSGSHSSMPSSFGDNVTPTRLVKPSVTQPGLSNIHSPSPSSRGTPSGSRRSGQPSLSPSKRNDLTLPLTSSSAPSATSPLASTPQVSSKPSVAAVSNQPSYLSPLPLPVIQPRSPTALLLPTGSYAPTSVFHSLMPSAIPSAIAKLPTEMVICAIAPACEQPSSSPNSTSLGESSVTSNLSIATPSICDFLPKDCPPVPVPSSIPSSSLVPTYTPKPTIGLSSSFASTLTSSIPTSEAVLSLKSMMPSVELVCALVPLACESTFQSGISSPSPNELTIPALVQSSSKKPTARPLSSYVPTTSWTPSTTAIPTLLDSSDVPITLGASSTPSLSGMPSDFSSYSIPPTITVSPSTAPDQFPIITLVPSKAWEIAIEPAIPGNPSSTLLPTQTQSNTDSPLTLDERSRRPSPYPANSAVDGNNIKPPSNAPSLYGTPIGEIPSKVTSPIHELTHAPTIVSRSCPEFNSSLSWVDSEVPFSYSVQTTDVASNFIDDFEPFLFQQVSKAILTCNSTRRRAQQRFLDVNVRQKVVRLAYDPTASEISTCEVTDPSARTCWDVASVLVVTTDAVSQKPAREAVMFTLRQLFNNTNFTSNGIPTGIVVTFETVPTPAPTSSKPATSQPSGGGNVVPPMLLIGFYLGGAVFMVVFVILIIGRRKRNDKHKFDPPNGKIYMISGSQHNMQPMTSKDAIGCDWGSETSSLLRDSSYNRDEIEVEVSQNMAAPMFLHMEDLATNDVYSMGSAQFKESEQNYRVSSIDDKALLQQTIDGPSGHIAVRSFESVESDISDQSRDFNSSFEIESDCNSLSRSDDDRASSKVCRVNGEGGKSAIGSKAGDPIDQDTEDTNFGIEATADHVGQKHVNNRLGSVDDEELVTNHHIVGDLERTFVNDELDDQSLRRLSGINALSKDQEKGGSWSHDDLERRFVDQQNSRESVGSNSEVKLFDDVVSDPVGKDVLERREFEQFTTSKNDDDEILSVRSNVDGDGSSAQNMACDANTSLEVERILHCDKGTTGEFNDSNQREDHGSHSCHSILSGIATVEGEVGQPPSKSADEKLTSRITKKPYFVNEEKDVDSDEGNSFEDKRGSSHRRLEQGNKRDQLSCDNYTSSSLTGIERESHIAVSVGSSMDSVSRVNEATPISVEEKATAGGKDLTLPTVPGYISAEIGFESNDKLQLDNDESCINSEIGNAYAEISRDVGETRSNIAAGDVDMGNLCLEDRDSVVDTAPGGDTPDGEMNDDDDSFEVRSWGFDEDIANGEDAAFTGRIPLETGDGDDDDETETTWSDGYRASNLSPIPETSGSNISLSVHYRQVVRGDQRSPPVYDVSSFPVDGFIELSAPGVNPEQPYASSSDSGKFFDSCNDDEVDDANVEGMPVRSLSNHHSLCSARIETANEDKLAKSIGSRPTDSNYDRPFKSESNRADDHSVDSNGLSFPNTKTNTGDRSYHGGSYRSDEHSVDSNGYPPQSRSVDTADRSYVSVRSNRSDDHSVDSNGNPWSRSPAVIDDRSFYSDSDRSDDISLDSGGNPLPRRHVDQDDVSYSNTSSYRSDDDSVDSNNQSLQNFQSADDSRGSPRTMRSDSEYQSSYCGRSYQSDARYADTSGIPSPSTRLPVVSTVVEPFQTTRSSDKDERSYDSCSYRSGLFSSALNSQGESYRSSISYMDGESRYSASISERSGLDSDCLV